MKTVIKQAGWQSSKPFMDGEPANIVTNIFWQSDDAFIDTDSKFLFKMICVHFFSKYEKKIELSLEGDIGMYFSDAYRLYTYNLLHKALTGKPIEYDILEEKDPKDMFYHVMLDSQMESHQQRVLEIIEILEIDFKEESERYGRILFKTKKKNNFVIKDKAWNDNITIPAPILVSEVWRS